MWPCWKDVTGAGLESLKACSVCPLCFISGVGDVSSQLYLLPCLLLAARFPLHDCNKPKMNPSFSNCHGHGALSQQQKGH